MLIFNTLNIKLNFKQLLSQFKVKFVLHIFLFFNFISSRNKMGTTDMQLFDNCPEKYGKGKPLSYTMYVFSYF